VLGKQGGDLLVSVLRQMSRSEVEAKPQEVRGPVKVAPMVSGAERFVDPVLQTADQIVRIYRSLEVSHPENTCTDFLNRLPFRDRSS